MKRILIDRCVLSDAITTLPHPITKKTVWGNQTHENILAGYIGKKLNGKFQQIKFLPSIAQAAKHNKIKLFTYDELQNESWFAKEPCKGDFGDIFANIKIEEVPSPICRSKLFPGYVAGWIPENVTPYVDKPQTKQLEFINFLLNVDVNLLLQEPILTERF